jgi:hypothetical protein
VLSALVRVNLILHRNELLLVWISVLSLLESALVIILRVVFRVCLNFWIRYPISVRYRYFIFRITLLINTAAIRMSRRFLYVNWS